MRVPMKFSMAAIYNCIVMTKVPVYSQVLPTQ
jgi:hypothetical protein